MKIMDVRGRFKQEDVFKKPPGNARPRALGAVAGLVIAMIASTAALAQSGKQVAVSQNADGRLEVFYIGVDDALYHSWQMARNGDFAGGAPLGDFAKQMTVGRNADGRLEIFYIGLDDNIYHINQVVPNGYWGGVYRLAQGAKQLTVAQNADGRRSLLHRLRQLHLSHQPSCAERRLG